MPSRYLPISLGLLFLPFGVLAESVEPTLCPTRLETKQVIENSPSGWSGFGEQVAQSKLENVSFFDGDPQQQAELAPSPIQVTKRHLKNTWHFSNLHNGSVWLQCVYADTRLALAKPLASSTSSCTATYDNRFTPPRLERLSCK